MGRDRWQQVDAHFGQRFRRRQAGAMGEWEGRYVGPRGRDISSLALALFLSLETSSFSLSAFISISFSPPIHILSLNLSCLFRRLLCCFSCCLSIYLFIPPPLYLFFLPCLPPSLNPFTPSLSISSSPFPFLSSFPLPSIHTHFP